MNKYAIPTTAAALIVFASIGFYAYKSDSEVSSKVGNPQPMQQMRSRMTALSFKDGTYNQTGIYLSPGGKREIDVFLTLIDNNITEIEVEPKADDATSKRFQGEFAANYKQMVMGKNINEVVLNKVSGSSLTPKGFNDAIEKIKAQASS